MWILFRWLNISWVRILYWPHPWNQQFNTNKDLQNYNPCQEWYSSISDTYICMPHTSGPPLKNSKCSLSLTTSAHTDGSSFTMLFKLLTRLRSGHHLQCHYRHSREACAVFWESPWLGGFDAHRRSSGCISQGNIFMNDWINQQHFNFTCQFLMPLYWHS